MHSIFGTAMRQPIHSFFESVKDPVSDGVLIVDPSEPVPEDTQAGLRSLEKLSLWD